MTPAWLIGVTGDRAEVVAEDYSFHVEMVTGGPDTYVVITEAPTEKEAIQNAIRHVSEVRMKPISPYIKDVTADLYPDADDMRRVARIAGIPVRYVKLSDTPSANAHNLWAQAAASGAERRLLDAMWGDYPSNPYILASIHGNRHAVGPSIEQSWRAPQEVVTQGRNTLRPVEWLDKGAEVARAVVRVRRPDGVYGTGLLLDGLYLVTNNHVIPSAEIALNTVVDLDFVANERRMTTMGLRPSEAFATRSDYDLTVVGVDGYVPNYADFNFRKQADAAVGHYCQIIQHPGGERKALGVYHNVITSVVGEKVQYLTDTLPGSSGSPVFDEDWNLIAIHHSGGWMKVGGPGGTMGYANEGTASSRLNELLDTLHA